MKYYSLAGQAPVTDFRTATLQGQAPDRGLYFPSRIPVFEKGFLDSLPRLPADELALQVMKPYVGDCIPETELHRIVCETLDFPIPLAEVCNGISCLELFHGPTLAFKDVGARFMSRCLGWFSSDNDRRTVVLVATSGDTGGAVAHGFHNVPGIEVVILYPSGKVSPVQEKQLTTLGGNIHALEVSGDFDDCQRLVKSAFADADLRGKVALSSANSINVARWLPQQLYYLPAGTARHLRPQRQFREPLRRHDGLEIRATRGPFHRRLQCQRHRPPLSAGWRLPTGPGRGHPFQRDGCGRP
jgi:threonine synthase